MASWRLHKTIHAIRRGAVIAYPSDTIWGLGCDPFNLNAVRRIQQIKRRPTSKGLILLGSELDQFHALVEHSSLSKLQNSDLSSTRKPTTWIVPVSAACPAWLRSAHNTIAIRVTQKPLIRTLCDALNSPIISTSANISGRPSTRNRLLVTREFYRLVDAILDDPLDHSRLNSPATASRIIDLQSGKILRD